jgi:hypothetical protein
MALLDDVSGVLDGWPHQPNRCARLPRLALGLPLITGPWLGTPRRYIEIYNERVKDLLNPMTGTDLPLRASDGV